MNGKDKTDVRVVRPVDRSVLGPEEADFVPLPITDDRNKNPLYAMWRCDDCGKFYGSQNSGCYTAKKLQQIKDEAD